MGTIWKKKKQNEAEREKKRKDERKVLTLTGLLMEGVSTLRMPD
jgi:adenylylsulfate kinase-like enzyme